MSKLRFKISISLDGFVAGPNQSPENPIGVGGMKLHEWVFPLAAWRSQHGMAGGEVNVSSAVIEESLVNIGATVMGRKMFGGPAGPWPTSELWNGWWDNNPPFHHPVFVLTHHPRPALTLEGGTVFHFVTDGIRSALEQAQRAAKGLDVSLAGGGSVARQYLEAGLVDEMLLSQVPVLLGQGERLFDGATELHGLKLVRTVAATDVTHLKFARG